MSLKRLVNSSDQIITIARLRETGANALFSVIQRKIENTRLEIEDKPCRDSNNLKNDLVYKLGFIAGLRYCLSLPTEAQKITNNRKMED